LIGSAEAALLHKLAKARDALLEPLSESADNDAPPGKACVLVGKIPGAPVRRLYMA
jgi:hypothetical protein